MSGGIGTLSERSLHAATKQWLFKPGDEVEVPVKGFVADLKRGEDLIEVQTGNFGSMKRKLGLLLKDHRVTVWYPLATSKWIVREAHDGTPISRRKSPKSERPLHLFDHIVRIPHLVPNPNLVLGVVKTHQEEHWRDDGQGSWRRRRWSIVDTALIKVVGTETYSSPSALAEMLPDSLPNEFTNRELADVAKVRLRLAQRVTYTLERCGALVRVENRGNAHAFTRSGDG